MKCHTIHLQGEALLHTALKGLLQYRCKIATEKNKKLSLYSSIALKFGCLGKTSGYFGVKRSTFLGTQGRVKHCKLNAQEISYNIHHMIRKKPTTKYIVMYMYIYIRI